MIDYLITGTRSVGNFYHETFGVSEKRMIFIPNEIDLNRFNPEKYDMKKVRETLGIKDHEKLVLFVHRIAERKGAHHIPRIIKKVCDEISDVKFVIAGNGPYSSTLNKRITGAGLEPHVKLLGRVPNRKIMELYAAADVFMMPSEEEGVPRVLLEAMAMGIPFVATDIGGVKDICTDLQKKWVVPVRDNVSFSERLIGLLVNDGFQNQLKKEGLKNIKNFSLDRIKRRFIKRILNDREDQ